MKQKNFWLKLIGVVFLLHIVLTLISILEVVIYSYLIVPGKEREFYSAHAAGSGPWISAIFGSLFMFLLVRRFIKKFSKQQLTYAIGLLLIYFVIDLVLFFISGYKFKDFAYQFVLASLAKIIAVSFAYYIYRNKNNSHQSNF